MKKIRNFLVARPPTGIPARKLRKIRKGSSTPGKTKVSTCKASPLERTMCRRSRAYKLRDYVAWANRTKTKTFRKL